jgi:hypothetical protein
MSVKKTRKVAREMTVSQARVSHKGQGHEMLRKVI